MIKERVNKLYLLTWTMQLPLWSHSPLKSWEIKVPIMFDLCSENIYWFTNLSLSKLLNKHLKSATLFSDLFLFPDLTHQWSGPLSSKANSVICIKSSKWFWCILVLKHRLVWDEAFLTSSWVMLLVVVQRPYFEKLCVKRMIQAVTTSSMLQFESKTDCNKRAHLPTSPLWKVY